LDCSIKPSGLFVRKPPCEPVPNYRCERYRILDSFPGPLLRRNLVNRPSIFGIPALFSLLLGASAFSPAGLSGQELDPTVKEAYLRAIADHFQVPVEEVNLLGEWDLQTDEIPMVLFLADRAGVSSDALAALRRNGAEWREIAGRYGLGAGAFYVPLAEGGPFGALDRAYNEFRARPQGEWSSIELTDAEITALVNIRVLSEHVGVTPMRVLKSREEAGSFAAGFPSLLGQGPVPAEGVSAVGPGLLRTPTG
jgi:hypothetical protein